MEHADSGLDDNEASSLIDAPIENLMARAALRRDAAFGNRITYSPKAFIPLTMLCRDRCGYCTFAKAPARVSAPYLEIEEVLEIARLGAIAGCREALFTLGEAPEERYPDAADWLNERGYSSTIEYLVAACGAVIAETGLLPHANAGALDSKDLGSLRRVSPSQGMMIETLAERLAEPGGPHHRAPDKTALRRLATLEAAGAARIPFTTGILVGIGESRGERISALLAIRKSHERHGHIQEVIVQNFLPKPGTAMHNYPACDPAEMLWSVAVARLVLPNDIHLQAPPNLADDLEALIAAGIDDWGGVSPVTPDHVNPERPWPNIDSLREATEEAGKTLAARLTIYPEYVCAPETWIDESLRSAVIQQSDSEGLARDDNWAAGSDAPPPQLILHTPAPIHLGPLESVLEGVINGEIPGEAEIVTLLGARGSQVRRVAEVADDLRRRTVGDVVTFVRNRNINYTNICTFKCKFCAFSKGPLSLNLRGTPYLLDMGEIQRRVLEAVDCGATEVCLQGGIHPDFDGDYYIAVTRAVKEVAPDIHIHGFTALEVTEGARRLGVDLADYLLEMKAAGLATLPGTAAEILDDEIRAVICPDKVNTQEWLNAHRIAHSVGLRSNVTIMFGHIERPINIARHFLAARELQLETGGFTEVVPLPFVHMASPIYIQGKARQGPTFREVLLIHAVARIALGHVIPNVQASWVKAGFSGARQILQAGANDLGGTLMDENISRAAGADHGQEADEADFATIAAAIGRPLEQRTTLYGRISTQGRRLRPAEPEVMVDLRRKPIDVKLGVLSK